MAQPPKSRSVAADVVEVFLGIHNQQAIGGAGGRGVTVDGGGRERVGAGVDHQSGVGAGDESGIDAPRGNVGEAGDGITARRDAHFPTLRGQVAAEQVRKPRRVRDVEHVESGGAAAGEARGGIFHD